MKRNLSKFNVKRPMFFMGLIVFFILFNSCKDDFFEKNTPSWLGASIYDQLQKGIGKGDSIHTFNNYVRLIDDLNYSEVLKKTGSKTLFVSDDAAFAVFYKSNPWSVKSYEGLSVAQKKIILNSGMIDNANLIEMLSNATGPIPGQSASHPTAYTVLDSIGLQRGDSLPANQYWNAYRNIGVYFPITKDASNPNMIHFLQPFMDNYGITNDDFGFILKTQRVFNDAYIFDDKVVVRDVTCKNGYINVLKNVLVPPGNMDEVIHKLPNTKIFARLLDRYSLPLYNRKITADYKIIHPQFKDSIFTLGYILNSWKSSPIPPDGAPKGFVSPPYGFDYSPSSNVSFGAMFVPTDQALNNYFFGTDGGGRFLMDTFGSIDNVPNETFIDLITNLTKPSLIASVPSKFDQILDDANDVMNVKKDQITESHIANNGLVYITNTVYGPNSYVSVIAPCKVNFNLRVFNWGVNNIVTQNSNFSAYLKSMDSRYSFLVPEDNDPNKGSMYYIDPVSVSKIQPEIFRFWYKPIVKQGRDNIQATAYKYDASTGTIGDSIRAVSVSEIRNRLEDLLDYHIVVGDIEDGKQYYRTKGNGEIKVNGTNIGSSVQGGGNIERSTQPDITTVYNLTKEKNKRGNGKTYILDSPLQPPLKSVYKILSETPEFSEFFKLLQGNDQASVAEQIKSGVIFYSDPLYAGIDYNVKFFNTFHYTVYVPTNDAVLAAEAQGLPTWDIIKLETDQAIKDSLSSALVNFLRFHFQDNSVYIDGTSKGATLYETAAYSLSGQKAFYPLFTKLSSNGMTVAAKASDLENSNAAHVITTSPLWNIMARDYKFDRGDPNAASAISTSSFAVIHQIDKVLLYRTDELAKIKRLVKRSVAKQKNTYIKRLAK